MTGAQSWQQAGAEERAEGEREYDAAQAQGYAEGTKGLIGGRKDAVRGDRRQEVSGALSLSPFSLAASRAGTRH